MTLALLLTAVTGAWAGEEPQLLTTIYASSSFLTGSQTFDDIATVTFGGAGTIGFNDKNGWIQEEYEKESTVTVTAVDGYTITSIKIYSADPSNATISTSPFTAYLNCWGATYVTTGSGGAGDYIGDELVRIEVYGYKSVPAIDVKWDPATKTGNFTMPAYDVEIAPIYAPVAQWAKVENVDQLPTAIEGVIADTDAPLIVEGTVAFAGTSTEVKQGTVMYAVTPATETEAPALDAANKWSADVPTAKLVPDAGDVKVWYYIKGADAPDGVAATLDNTFDNTEPACLTVQVLTNKFDIQFNAANANTIEAGKATVTVGGTAATVTEGKLQGVKMGSEVKVKANTGYKFRKVEVKKKAAAKPLANATTEDLGKVVGADGKIYATKADAEAVATGNAVAMICYVNEGHGLALALSDEGDMDWNTALTTCAAHTPAVTGATWKLASKSEMNLMINAAGNYAALRNGFSAVGGTNMSDDHYWLSDESTADYAQYIEYYDGSTSQEFKSDSYKVRACLEW